MEQLTREWFAMLRLPPHRDRYPVRPADYACGCVASGAAHPSGRSGDWSHIGKGSAATEITFPGGAKMRCNGCGARWLVVEEAAAAEEDGASGGPPSPGLDDIVSPKPDREPP